MDSYSNYFQNGFLTLKRGCEYLFSHTPLINGIYWKCSPRYYQWKIQNQIDHDVPLDPLKLVWVTPEDIIRFSGRKNIIYNRWQDVGRVCTGDWDQRPPKGPTGKKKNHLQGVFTAESIEETVLFKSIEQHFECGVDWEETELFHRIYSAIQSGITVWRGSQSREDILQRCLEIDQLYENIRDNGYKTQFELIEKEGLSQNHVGYLDVLTDEITVDISRSGELLFADGRHRICIAKVLGLDYIPICILVRHKDWLEKRRDIFYEENLENKKHPDLAETNGLI